MAWVTISPAGTTTATKFFGDALNKIDNMFNAVNIADTVKINSAVTWSFVNTALRIRNPADTFSYIFTPSAITADRILTVPLITGNESIVTDKFIQTITNKKFDTSCTIIDATVASKVVAWSLSGMQGSKTKTLLFTGATQTITFPDNTFTVVGKDTVDIFTNKSLNANGTGNVITNIGDPEIKVHTSTKITITNKAQLNANIVYIDQANTYGDFTQLFKDNQLNINNPADTFKYIITAGAIAADRILNLPVTIATDTFPTLGLAQTFTGANTFSGANIFSGGNTFSTVISTFKSSMLGIRNPADTFTYTLVASAIVAARNLTIPLLTADDTMVVQGVAPTFGAGIKVTADSDASFAAFRDVGNAGDPSSLSNGDFWHNTTTNTFKVRLNGSVRTLVNTDEAQTFISNAKTFNSSILLIRNPADTFSYTLVASAITAARNLTIPLITQAETLAIVPQTAQSSPGDPTGTTSTTGLMMGLAGTITPRVTGKLYIIISGDISNDTATNGAKVQIRHGTGSAPANGAALTGTTVGGLVQFTMALGAQKVPFSIQGIVSGLTVGTAYWLDVGLAAITAGTANIRDLSVTAFEL